MAFNIIRSLTLTMYRATQRLALEIEASAFNCFPVLELARLSMGLAPALPKLCQPASGHGIVRCMITLLHQVRVESIDGV